MLRLPLNMHPPQTPDLWHHAGRCGPPPGSTGVPSLWLQGRLLRSQVHGRIQTWDQSSGARAFPACTVSCSVLGSVRPPLGSTRTPERSSTGEKTSVTAALAFTLACLSVSLLWLYCSRCFCSPFCWVSPCHHLEDWTFVWAALSCSEGQSDPHCPT